MTDPSETKRLASWLVRDSEAELEQERMAYMRDDASRMGWSDVGTLALLILFWLLAESVMAAPDNPEAVLSTTSYSSLWLKSYDFDSQVTAVHDHETRHDQAVSNQASRYPATSFSATTLDTNVSISVSGPVLRARVRQTFRNPSQMWAEGIYSFPLPEQAAIDHMRMRVGDRIIEGQIHEKKAAKRQYNQARASGKRVSLLSQHRTNVFTTAVANIGPGEEITIEFEYQQLIDFKDNGYSFRFPMVNTPQYTPPEALQNPTFDAPINAIRSLNEAPGNPVSVQVDLKAGFPVEIPVSVSHNITHQRLNEDHYLINLNGSAAQSNRDFQLAWQLMPTEKPMASVLREDVDGQSYGLLMLMPPQEAISNTQRELVFVLDVSGSMHGESIEQARAALLKAINTLGTGDSFNVIWFNTQSWKLFPQSRMATPDNLRLARNRVPLLQADGGTEMLPAIHMALKAPSDPERLRQVVFITDGAVGNETQLFTEIKNNLGRSRLFTVGIGSAPNSYFMRKAAQAGRGVFTYVSQPAEVDEKINNLLHKLSVPVLTDLDIDLNGHSANILPDPLPDLYQGEPVYIAFKADSFPAFASIKGNIDGVPSWLRVPLYSPHQQKGVAVEWARRKITHLLGQHRESVGDQQQALRETIVDLAVKHHQVSKFTSLLAVDVTPVRAGAQLNSSRIPANRPKGWRTDTSRSETGIRLAQTATDSELKLLLGTLLLILAAVLMWLRRRVLWLRAC